MKTFSQRRALQAVDLNSISNLYLASLQPYLIELSMAGGGYEAPSWRVCLSGLVDLVAWLVDQYVCTFGSY